MPTLALIDQHPITLRGLYAILKARFSDLSILSSVSIPLFQTEYPDMNPDLIILGISQTADMNNYASIGSAEQQFPGSNVILYDQRPDLVMAGRYIKKGISYLTKENETSEMIDCVKLVMAGKQYVCKEFAGSKQTGPKNTLLKTGTLTRREYEIAGYLSQGKGTNDIAQLLGRKAPTISTIKSHIFKKLQVNNIIRLREVLEETQS